MYVKLVLSQLSMLSLWHNVPECVYLTLELIWGCDLESTYSSPLNIKHRPVLALFHLSPHFLKSCHFAQRVHSTLTSAPVPLWRFTWEPL